MNLCSFGRLSVTIQLTLLAVLMGAGLVAMFVLAVLELRETSIGGRYYAEMRARPATGRS
jgi:hypothetical protein